MIRLRAIPVALLVAVGALPAQQLLWQAPAVAAPPLLETNWMKGFADYDGDGCLDFVRAIYDPLTPYLDIVSGRDGSLLLRQWHWLGFFGDVAHAGDFDGDGVPDMIAVRGQGTASAQMLEVYSPSRNVVFWQYTGQGLSFGSEVLGNLDTDGDGLPDVVTKVFEAALAEVYVFDHYGALRYTIPCLAQGRRPASLADMGDMDGDGCADILIGCLEPTGRGLQWLVSGRTGATIRETYGPLPGAPLALNVCNLGDIDGDGVNDYAAFPWYSSTGLLAAAYSGASGAVIRTWADGPNSVVAGEDFDQDGVPDLVTGADWYLWGNLYGRTHCWSGRDGSELWRVEAVLYPQGTGFHGTSGWMMYSASLGVQPGNPYPVVAWLNTEEMASNYSGLIRVYGGARAGQGPVTGTACTSAGPLPRIGVRKLGQGAANTGFRTTVAKTHADALAALHFAFAPLAAPVDLSPYGFPGCTAYVDPAAAFLRLTGTAGIDRGYAAVDLPHPLSAAAAGTDVQAQWFVLEPVTGAYAATQRHTIRLP
ncbi:MAG: VCBS repeat-containing protein [Planctomycetes bacterium]|nr:VCBS repeat-containing protein [Planctomycetota bacterium]